MPASARKDIFVGRQLCNERCHTRSGHPIDHEHLNRYTLGDYQIECEILELFASQLPRLINDLKRAVSQRNRCAWLEASHAMKGAAQAVGALQIAQLACEAEQAVDTFQNFDITELVAAADVVMSHINEYGRHYADRKAYPGK